MGILDNNKKYNRNEIGLRIKLARISKDLTQQELADVTNVGEKHIGMIEKGNNGVSIPSLVAICDALDLSLDYVVRGTTGSTPFDHLLAQLPEDQEQYAFAQLKLLVNAYKFGMVTNK